MELERQLFSRLLDYPLLVLTKSGADEKRHHYLQKMIIKRLTTAHTKDVFNLLQHVAADMSAKGIQQWNSNYPTLEHVLGDIESDSLFAAFQGNEIIGVIAMDDKQSPEYTAIPWKYNSGQIMVVHRLAVSPDHQGEGIGKYLMDYALETALENGYHSIRLDAYSKNERTLNFYRNRDYEFRGEIYFAYREDPFYCFEKKLR